MLLSRCLWGATLLLVPLLAQSPPRKSPPPKPVTGLKAIGATLDRDTHDETIQIQNVSDRTATAYTLRIAEFDAQGNELGDANFRQVGFDWATPDADPNNTNNYILPGRIVSFSPGKAGLDAASVAATITAVVYDDGTHEGLTQAFFLTRATRAREAREAAAKETSAQKKAELNKRAEWYEAHGPKEATK